MSALPTELRKSAEPRAVQLQPDYHVPDSDSLQRLSEWIDGQLSELESRFEQFQTPASVRRSIGR